MSSDSSFARSLFDREHATRQQLIYNRIILGSILLATLVLVPATWDPAMGLSGTILDPLNLVCYLVFGLDCLFRVISMLTSRKPGEQGTGPSAGLNRLIPLTDLLVLVPFIFGLPLDLRILKLLRALEITGVLSALSAAAHEFQVLNQGRTTRQKIYALLYSTPSSGKLHVYVDNALMGLILLSTLLVILESVAVIESHLQAEFQILDYLAVTVFGIEYLLRVYVIPEHKNFSSPVLGRLKYLSSPTALIDLVAIAPYFIEPLIGHLFDLRFMRIFRLVRLLKLTRYTSSLKILGQVFARESQILGAAGFLMLLLVMLAASLGYLFEHEAQPDKFENIPQSIYWAVITLASVGYGDLSPVTPMGRLMTIVLAIVGVGIFALPAGLLSSAFSDQLRLERERLQRLVSQSLEDGVLTEEEKSAIEMESKRLHLSADDIDHMIQDTLRTQGRTAVKPDDGQPAMAAAGLGNQPTDANTSFSQLNLLFSQASLIMATSDLEQLKARFDNPELSSSQHKDLFYRLLDQNTGRGPTA